MDTAAVDKVNLILLLLAFAVAYLIPFELLLISYAFLGPLHYLTEISWLHDRKYFTTGSRDPIYLTVLSFVMLFFGAAVFPNAAEFVWILLLFAFCTAFIKSFRNRLIILLIGLLLLIPFFGSTTSYVMAVMVPTVIHVYLFTLLFMIFGSLKSKSKLGLYNAALFFVGGIILLLLPQSNVQFLGEYVAEHYIFFESISVAIGTYIGQSSVVVISTIASFLAFTYTYHYLNWFSKTSIIEWHRVSKLRMSAIGSLYICSVGLYLYDYTLGFIVLLSLSFLHVVLEFPLNFKSIAGIYTAAKKS